ncbi:MAG: hypothetical protein U9Q63_00020 [Patescibacteria group bacterium]|nr:hypothetical protein [Patescibacteria group bacterium]
MTKVQLALTDQETTILNNYGSQFGYNLSKTIRFLISKAAESFLMQKTLPIFKMSPQTEAIGLKALKDHRAGKTTEIKDIDSFFDKL